MAIKYCSDGGFVFPADFGFTGSTKGQHSPKSHAPRLSDDYGDGLAKGGPAKKAMGGPMPPMPGAAGSQLPAVTVRKGGALRRMADGGPMNAPAPLPAPPQNPPQAMTQQMAGMPRSVPPTVPQGSAVVPTQHAADAARGAFMLGAMHGMQAARAPRPRAQIARTPPTQMGQAAPASMASSAPALAKGGRFIQQGIKHPGRMKKLAAEHGRSVHAEMEHDKHSSDPSLRSAANLGLRLTGGDLNPRKRKG